MKPWLLSSLSVAVLLLTLAGCSYGPEKFHTAAKPPPMRTREQIANDSVKTINDLELTIHNVKDAKTAKDAIPKVNEAFGRLMNLVQEGQAVARTLTPEKNKQLDEQPEPNRSMASLSAAVNDLNKISGLPPELRQAFLEQQDKLQQAEDAAKAEHALPPLEVLPENPPNSSCWVVWFLCLFVLAACVGFLFRDGLWSNAIVLVNVVFAGLLAMNFYEPLANFMTYYNDDVHSYVAFFDFLALWVCFVLAASVFRAATDAVSKVRVRFLKIVDYWGGVVLSLCVGWVMVGFTLTSLHAAPLAQYPVFGTFQPQSNMFFGAGPGPRVARLHPV